VTHVDQQLAKARRAYRESMLAAKAQGVSNVELAKALGTSESRVRQELARGVEEAEQAG
jgi:DNA-directed RNA polymerase specialized sigma24 family protein